jgi:hypothetical protein
MRLRPYLRKVLNIMFHPFKNEEPITRQKEP